MTQYSAAMPTEPYRGYGRPAAQIMNPYGASSYNMNDPMMAMQSFMNNGGSITVDPETGRIVSARGGGGGGGGGGGMGSYLGAQEQAAATRYGWDTQYRMAEGNARRDWDVANLNNQTQRYLGELGSGDNRYMSDNQRYGGFDIANLQRQASDYGNLMNYYGRDLKSSRALQEQLGVAGMNMQGALGVADRNMWGQLGVADRNLQGTYAQTDAQRYGFDRALEQALADANARRYASELGLEGQLAGYGSNERIAKTQTQPQILDILSKQWRFKQAMQSLLPFVTQAFGRMFPAQQGAPAQG